MNQLTGSIPLEVGPSIPLDGVESSWEPVIWVDPGRAGQPARLRRLYLSNNQLSGSISPEFGNLSSLRDLVLWGNQLAGPIPPEVGNLTNLRRLLVKDNRLTGCIPAQLRETGRNDLAEIGLPYCGQTALERTAPSAPSGGRLQQIRDRGKVICAIRNDVAGFSHVDDSGCRVGFGLDLCSAVVAAVLGDPDAV